MSIVKKIILSGWALITVFSVSGCNAVKTAEPGEYSIVTSPTILDKPAIAESKGYNVIVSSDIPSDEPTIEEQTDQFSLHDIEDFNGQPYTIINSNIPYFEKSEETTKSFEQYSELDSLGRCGTAYACIGKDLMPTEERGQIGSIKPSGWHLIKYDNVDGKYLYNRCHLIAYQLSGENANERNLITGTRYLNIEGMLPFENMTADYVKATGNHVLYRVTPIFDGNNLLSTGVLMEGYSVEDNGEGICFNVFCYNVQPDIKIDYSNGESEELIANTETTDEAESEPVDLTYIVNTNTGKFHYPSCSSTKKIKSSNKMEYTGGRDELVAQGYEPCKNCRP